MSDKWKGHTAILCANMIFGLNIPISKILLTHWMTPLGFMASRTLVASIVFWGIQVFLPKEKVTTKDLVIIAVGGIMGFVISQSLTAVSLQYTTPVYFSLTVALSPLFVMFLAALFLKEPITRRKIAGVLSGIAGAILLISQIPDSSTGKNNLFGIVLALISVMSFSGYLIVIRRISQKYSTVTQMKWMFLFAATILIPLCFAECPHQRLFSSEWTLSGICEWLFVTVLATSVAYFLTPYGMRYLRATTVSVYMNLQPIVASLAAICIGQDVFSWDKPVAALFVIAGAYIVSTSPSKQGLRRQDISNK